jgi:hypothetical protein
VSILIQNGLAEYLGIGNLGNFHSEKKQSPRFYTESKVEVNSLASLSNLEVYGMAEESSYCRALW